MLTETTLTRPLTAWMQSALRTHLDPEGGSLYWRERAESEGISVEDLHTLDDLAAFGRMDEEAMRTRPLSDFIPRSVQAAGHSLIPSETGGATGQPKLTAFTPAEFNEGFIVPFLRVAEAIHFPRGGNWMFVGPTGPHIIGRAARSLAVAMGANEPFNVDFDPRWHRRLTAGSLGQRRHMDHIVEQALHILARVEINVLFITPRVLERLLPHMSDQRRTAIRGIHFGGQRVTESDLAEFAKWFPRAVQVAGYGNSLVGVCMQVLGEPGATVAYHPGSERHVVRLLADPVSSLTEEVAIGERGRVMFHRFDESFLLLNMVERDIATRLAPSPLAVETGLVAEGIGDPGPVVTQRTAPSDGIY